MVSRTGPIEHVTPDGRKVVIRTLETTDAEAVLACVIAESRHSDHIYIETDELLAEITVEIEREKIDGWLRGECELGLGVFPVDSAECVGTLTFKAPSNRRRARHRGMFGVAVLPAWRGKGVGTAMINAMLGWAREHPIVEIVSLGCYATNTRALALYRRLGFAEEGRSVDFFRFERPDGSVGYADDVQMTMRVGDRAETGQPG